MRVQDKAALLHTASYAGQERPRAGSRFGVIPGKLPRGIRSSGAGRAGLKVGEQILTTRMLLVRGSSRAVAAIEGARSGVEGDRGKRLTIRGSGL